MKIRPCIECSFRALKLHELLFWERVKMGQIIFYKIDLLTVYKKLYTYYNSIRMEIQTTTQSVTQKKGPNKGEKDEIKCKMELFEKRMDIEYCTAIFGSDAEEGIDIIDIETGKPYKDISDIKKAKSLSKADIIILLKKTHKQLNISIKSKTGAKPSIINHTPRSANVFQNECLKDDVCYLDVLAKEYIDKRKQDVIGEDVELGNLSSYNDENVKNSLIKLLVYFTFKGTGSKTAEHECNAILIINRNGTLSFILCDTEREKESYIETIIEKSIISFRNKGMPKNITEQCMPWVYANDSGKQCGSIHIRLAHL
jgi:hypothetical protein